MSNDYDGGRNDGGQFDGGLGMNATHSEQAMYGVTSHDTPQGAAAKVEFARRAAGLAPHTGAFIPTGQTGGGGYSGHRDIGDGKGTRFFVYLWRFVLWCILAPAIVAGLCWGALWEGRVLDGPTLARRLAASAFPGEVLPEPSELLPAKELMRPVDPKTMMAEFKAPLHGAGDSINARRPHLGAQAYRCLMAAGCREQLARTDAFYAERLPRLVIVNYLGHQVEKGDEKAARVMCLMPLLTGSSYKDALLARDTCAEVMRINPGSEAARVIYQRLMSNWSMWVALGVWVGGAGVCFFAGVRGFCWMSQDSIMALLTCS
ncbi:hypothetical protein ACO0LO_22310 [Undibacterium sp. TJN25]|uniref:hypothetical protein n=1 Tax=Undibacterium sp. TJN25 TaxID=3413056 RepID=UPI003BEF7D0E